MLIKDKFFKNCFLNTKQVILFQHLKIKMYEKTII